MLPDPNSSNQQEQLRQLQAAIDKLSQQRAMPGFNMSLVQTPTVPEPSHKIRYVSGFDGAREYQSSLPNDSTEIVADDADDIFYIVSKDAEGKCPRKISFVRVTIEQEPDGPKYVTQDDLAAFKADILDAIKGGKT